MENIETKNITKMLSEMEEIMYERREIKSNSIYKRINFSNR